MANKFPGRCKCGNAVDTAAGTVSKVHGRWVVTCAACQTSSKPAMAYNDAIEWPNGGGFTECTREYAEATDTLDLVMAEYLDLPEAVREYFLTGRRVDHGMTITDAARDWQIAQGER